MTIDELIEKVRNSDNAWFETLSSNSKIVHFDDEPNAIVFWDKTRMITHVFQEVEIENSIVK